MGSWLPTSHSKILLLRPPKIKPFLHQKHDFHGPCILFSFYREHLFTIRATLELSRNGLSRVYCTVLWWFKETFHLFILVPTSLARVTSEKEVLLTEDQVIFLRVVWIFCSPLMNDWPDISKIFLKGRKTQIKKKKKELLVPVVLTRYVFLLKNRKKIF